MPDENPLGERGRALEDDYFRKRDRELIDRMRRASAAENERQALSSKTGLDDPAMIEELRALGFTPETVPLLIFVPLVQMAWAEGGVSDAERRVILQLARTRGIEEGGPADRQLTSWLASRPDPQVFTSAARLIGAMFDRPVAGSGQITADDLVKYCEDIAAASGGILGLNKVSSEERALLSTLASDLKTRRR